MQVVRIIRTNTRQHPRREILIRRRRRIANPLMRRFRRALRQRMDTLRREDATTAPTIIVLGQLYRIAREPRQRVRADVVVDADVVAVVLARGVVPYVRLNLFGVAAGDGDGPAWVGALTMVWPGLLGMLRG